MVTGSVQPYRLPFFEGLRAALAADGIALTVLAGDGGGAAAGSDWLAPAPTRRIGVGTAELCWQPVLRRTGRCRLVVVEQAARLLVNYPLVARQGLGGPPVALWGHGASCRSPRASEAVKGALSRRVHWWFGYTDRTAGVLARLGYPPERTTVVDNATDTSALRRSVEALPADEVGAWRDRIGVTGERVGIFIGSLYGAKEVPLLLEAAERIRAGVPDFELVVVGDGPDRRLVDAAARRHRWIHPVGEHRGTGAAPFLRMARVALVPGAVGLAILDVFAAGCPLVTRDVDSHGPEIAYLDPDVNGVAVTTPDAGAYAEAVIRLLGDGARLDRLATAASATAAHLTVERMVERFAGGVVDALTAPPVRHGRPVRVQPAPARPAGRVR